MLQIKLNAHLEPYVEPYVSSEFWYINDMSGVPQMFLEKVMTAVMNKKSAIMVSSNHHIKIKDTCPEYVPPFSPIARNFVYLKDLKGDSLRTQWWESPEITPSADELTRLGQYAGDGPAAIITEQPVTKEAIATAFGINEDKIRQVGHYFIPSQQVYSKDYFSADFSKADYSTVFFQCNVVKNTMISFAIIQFIKIIEKIHNEGAKLIVQTDDKALLLTVLTEFLNIDIYYKQKQTKIMDRLRHLFPDF